jgi:GNAT superfamily N-acetyltransferase
MTDTDVVTLRDGAKMLIRPLEPADADDLQRGIEHLSPESRYRRFLGTPHIGSAELRYLTNVDHVNHEALTAIPPGSEVGVAVARYVRSTEDPASAEVAVAVEDAWQGRGVGAALIDRLAAHARAEGITRFTGLMLARNEPMIALLRRLGETRIHSSELGTVEAAVDLR